MKPEIKKLWLKALRSGKYLRVSGALKRKRGDGKMGYCCLGVLCDIYQKETGKGIWTGEEGGDYRFLGKVGPLPHEVKDWAGLDSQLGAFPDAQRIDGKAHLASTNDVRNRRGFFKVVNLIERYF